MHFVFSTLGENKTKMKRCIPHNQLCLSAYLDFTERNGNEKNNESLFFPWEKQREAVQQVRS